jgi:hypothetical protein
MLDLNQCRNVKRLLMRLFWLLRWARAASQVRPHCSNRAALYLEFLEARVVPALTYHNGPLIANVQAEAVYYNDPTGVLTNTQGNLNAFLGYIVGSPYMDMLSQYNDGGQVIRRGSLTGSVQNSITINSTVTINKNSYHGLSDADIQRMLSTEITQGVLSPNPNTLYIVFVPPGDAVIGPKGNNSVINFSGYHYYYQYSNPSTGATQDVYYAVIAYPGNPNTSSVFLTSFQTLTATITHELAEAVTDPTPGTLTRSGWFDPNLGGAGEVGDLEDADFSTLNSYVVQDLWSNSSNGPMRTEGTSFFINSFANPIQGDFSGVIGTFTDTNPGPNPSYVVTVGWGDGTTSSATVTPAGGDTYQIVANHHIVATVGAKLNLQISITNTLTHEQAQSQGLHVITNQQTNVKYGFNDLGLVTVESAELPSALAIQLLYQQTLDLELVTAGLATYSQTESQFLAWFAVAQTQSPQDATSLVLDEIFLATGEAQYLGTGSDNAQQLMMLNRLQVDILANPLYDTQTGFLLGVWTEALTLEALFGLASPSN